MRRSTIWILTAFAVLAAGCGGDRGTGPTSGGSGPMSAAIDGTAWTASAQNVRAQRTSSPDGSVISLAGASTGINIALAFPDSGAKTYQMGPPAFASNAILFQGAAGWVANPSGGTGTITITTLTSTRVAGTFQFSGAPVPGSGASGTRQVTNGQFDLTF